MGRGRNKAKAKKVARDLKYNTDGVDFDSLAEELHRQAKKSINKQNTEETSPGEKDTGKA